MIETKIVLVSEIKLLSAVTAIYYLVIDKHHATFTNA